MHLRRASLEPVANSIFFLLDTESLGELEMLLGKEGRDRRIVWDLKDLTLVDREVVSFLRRSEADGIQLKNCPAHIRAWLDGKRREWLRERVQLASNLYRGRHLDPRWGPARRRDSGNRAPRCSDVVHCLPRSAQRVSVNPLSRCPARANGRNVGISHGWRKDAVAIPTNLRILLLRSASYILRGFCMLRASDQRRMQ